MAPARERAKLKLLKSECNANVNLIMFYFVGYIIRTSRFTTRASMTIKDIFIENIICLTNEGYD